MRKFGWVLAMGLVVGMVAGCGSPSKSEVASSLQTQAEKLESVNYQSEAKMTVQMDNGAQTYYVHTSYESPDVYKIELGDANKNINQVIVRNANGMFVVSPSLQKVFRFNGNWAQNQGHLYLYDQLLQQLATDKNVKLTKQGSDYLFALPSSQDGDIVSRQEVTMDAKTFTPKKVVLYDKDDTAVVTLQFTSFTTNVKYQDADFDPHKIASSSTKATMAPVSDKFVYIEPDVESLGDQLDVTQMDSATSALLRYTGDHTFTLAESIPSPGVAGLPEGQLVDLYGVPALYAGTDSVHQLVWLNNGYEFSLASGNLTLEQMKSLAISTFNQVGK
ncbi:sporulation protein YdcC [Alicyclobacillus contaminans]|uniref:LolA family protein n=1 Tax=Alicyclobacillus contaminans TaxID=392016 RepID=UPI000422F2CB|nr:outer membrane lipoprotein carrier protein LolA [Alicyclobacillus contaminans]GMA51142.1 sporulation protein YdcC [Alicyclobacillus contaminans]